MRSTTYSQIYTFNTPNTSSIKHMTTNPTKTICEDQKYDHMTSHNTYLGDIEYDRRTLDTEIQNYKNMDVTKETSMP